MYSPLCTVFIHEVYTVYYNNNNGPLCPPLLLLLLVGELLLPGTLSIQMYINICMLKGIEQYFPIHIHIANNIITHNILLVQNIRTNLCNLHTYIVFLELQMLSYKVFE